MSIKVSVYNQKAEKKGDLDLVSKVFGQEMNEALVHQAVLAQMGNERQVLAHTKDRSEVRGGGKKPWRQKGTGRARVGSNRSPIWIGGGVTFGPRSDRNFSKDINRKMKQKALLIALSDKVSTDSFVVLDKIQMEEYKTKVFNEMVTNLEEKVIKKDENSKKRSVLIVTSEKDDKVKISANNLSGIKVINLSNINIVDLLKYKNLVVTEDCVKKIEEKYAK